ncbi:MAG TPA: RNA ligase family protein, partial [Candidatus Aquilonibacter sp.]|nr:RNA ligase family protein [Candidatus Aquilonibacter sp.]
GEGYGAKIQKGGQYRQDQSLIVFDVRVGEWWLKPDAVKDVADKLGLDVVPTFDTMTLRDAVALVQGGNLHSHWPDAKIEGLVGRPAVDLYTRKGDRIVAKVKVKDFIDYERRKAS